MNIRHFISIMEKYTPDNVHLRNYLRDEEFDPYAQWYYVCEWLIENHDTEEIAEWFGVDPSEVNDAGEMNEMEPELFYKLPPEIQKQCARAVIDQVLHDDPAEAPTWAHMMLAQDKLVKRTTWLIHFSDDAYSIRSKGFRYGIDQMDKLGLTTYYTTKAKEGGGYNFAVEANSRYADAIARDHKYGRDAVMFQNSGVKAWHHGDEESQIIFWGKDVNPRDIIYLSSDGSEWTVHSRVALRNGADVLFRGDFEDAVGWVMRNADRYRRVL